MITNFVLSCCIVEVVIQLYDLVCDNADVALKRACYLITGYLAEVALQFGGSNCVIFAVELLH